MTASWTALALILAYIAWKVATSIPDLVAWVQLERLPHAPRKLVTGHWQPGNVMQNPHLRWLAWHKELGGLFCSRLLWRHVVIIADPVIAEQLIQIDKGRQVDKLRGPYKNFQMLADPDHPSMFTSPTDNYWHAVRKGLAPAFNTANIRQGFGNIADLMQKVVAFLHVRGPEESRDVDLIAARVALDAISRTGFGYEMGFCEDLGAPPQDTPYIAALDSSVFAIRKWMLAPWVLRYLSFLPVAQKDSAAIQGLRRLNMHLLQQLRAKPPPASTLGAHMLKLVDPVTGKPMSDKQLLGEITIMYVAGWDTSAHTIAFTCGLISQHAEVEDKIAQELEGLGLLATEQNPHPRQITHDDLALLTYTSAVIKESMRMFPVGAFGTARTSKQPLQVGGHWLPANTPCILNFYAMFNSPFYWDQPEVFSPERWLEPGCEYMQSSESNSRPSVDTDDGQPQSQRLSENGAAEDTAHLSSSSSCAGQRTKRFFPFSEGMRNCIGQNLARMTVLTFIAVLCSNFKLRMADKMGGLEGMRASQRMNLTLKPADGIFLHYIPRAPQPSTAKS